MKILSITAGAAGMYCGSCFRDNALAAELIRQGHDVTLMPVYTPTRTDEPNVSDARRVLFGGISVYLQQKAALFRRMPRMVDRLLDAPAVIKALSGGAVATAPEVLGELTLSMLAGDGGALHREFTKLMEWIDSQPIPDVINLPNSLLIAMAAPLRRATGRPVCCTLQGEELFIDGLLPRYRDAALERIRAQVPTVDQYIAVSEFCARHMAGYLGIPADRISVVPLGASFDREPPRASGGRTPGTIGYFARIAPEKGLRELAAAFATLSRRMGARAPRLEAAGYMAPSQAGYLDAVRRDLKAAGCLDRFTYRGELDFDGKQRFLSGLDVLSVPATYDEPKGLFLLEAMACGVPVVQPRRGAFIEVVEKTGGGLLVDPGNPDRLADGLEQVLTDTALAAGLRQRAYDGVRRHYDLRQAAARLLTVYEGVTSPTAP